MIVRNKFHELTEDVEEVVMVAEWLNLSILTCSEELKGGQS